MSTITSYECGDMSSPSTPPCDAASSRVTGLAESACVRPQRQLQTFYGGSLMSTSSNAIVRDALDNTMAATEDPAKFRALR